MLRKPFVSVFIRLRMKARENPFRFEMMYRTRENPTIVNRERQPAAKMKIPILFNYTYVKIFFITFLTSKLLFPVVLCGFINWQDQGTGMFFIVVQGDDCFPGIFDRLFGHHAAGIVIFFKEGVF